MKHGMSIKLAVLALSIAVVQGCGSDPAEDGLVEDLGSLMPGEPSVPEVADTLPENVKVLFADDLVHVSRVVLRPGESVPELESGHRLYYLPRGTAELAVDVDGDMTMTTLTSGNARYVEPGAASITNVGALPIELIEVARTVVMLPEYLETEAQDPIQPYEVVLENDQVRVREVTLESGETAELARVPVRLVYPLTESTLEYRPIDDDVVPIPGGPAAAYSRPGDDLSVTNPGEESVTIVTFDWLS